MLNISDLSKVYPNGVKALNGVTLSSGRGVFGLLGPNGSGKSTLMRTMATLQEADEGSIWFGGINVLKDKEAMRKVLGYLPQEFGLYPNVAAEDLLHHLAILKGIVDRKQRVKSVNDLLEMTNLTQHRKKKLGGFSGGMKQRFGIAQALLGNPKIIIADEPTAGLDPEERARFHRLLSLIGNEILVILSTHIVSDLKGICQKMAIMAKGTVLMQASPSEAVEQLKGKIWEGSMPLSHMNILSSRLVQGKELFRLYSAIAPGDDYVSVEAELEDAYFSHIKGYVKHEQIPILV